MRQFRPHVLVECCEAVPVDSSHVFVERIHEDGERQIALELRRGSREDELPPRIRAGGELGQQTRLADARLTDQQHRRRAVLIELVQQSIERTHLLGAADEVLGMHRHFSSGAG